MKIFLLSILFSVSVFAAESLYPLRCGTYQIFSSAKFGSRDHKHFSATVVLREGSLSETRLDLTWDSSEPYSIPGDAWVTGTIDLTKVTGPATLEGKFISTPKVLPNKEKLYAESIDLTKEHACTH